MYCEFEETGDIFKNKKIYKCKNCNLTLALENPNANITCFSYNRTVFNQELNNDITGKPVAINTQDDIDHIARSMIEQRNAAQPTTNTQPTPTEATETLCTEEQINDRLAICNKCEFYEKNACTLCGCHIVREKNYMNKLAKKDAMCPDGRWGPVND